MTKETARTMIDAIRKEEYSDFVNAMQSIIKGETDRLDVSKAVDCPWVDVEIFHLDDEVMRGQVIAITKARGGDPFRFAEGETRYTIKFKDGNDEIWCEDAQQVCAGDLSAITEFVKELDIDTEIMLANYLNLSPIEKTFLSEFLGDEQWVIAHKRFLVGVFKDDGYAPNGDEWECACFAKTQREIRDKVAKGTKYE